MTNDKRKVTIIVDDSDLRKYKKILVDEGKNMSKDLNAYIKSRVKEREETKWKT